MILGNHNLRRPQLGKVASCPLLNCPTKISGEGRCNYYDYKKERVGKLCAVEASTLLMKAQGSASIYLWQGEHLKSLLKASNLLCQQLHSQTSEVAQMRETIIRIRKYRWFHCSHQIRRSRLCLWSGGERTDCTQCAKANAPNCHAMHPAYP